MPELHFARFRGEAKYTHQLFRFPAKFHPPAVRCLISRYSKPGANLLDPFCGSGTLLVESLISGRSATGIDIDPVATFISRVKCRPIEPKQLQRDFSGLQRALKCVRRAEQEYDRLTHDDLHPVAIKRLAGRLDIPEIPNLSHWFRTYIILDLARLRRAIEEASLSGSVRSFFLACFAAIIRNASNADPVPVSGLEVTAHMRRLDKLGRRIDPFQLFENRVQREMRGMGELWDSASEGKIRVRRGDATAMRGELGRGAFDLVLTSPPYNTAVDYYRRHTLEMYWLRFVTDHEERVRLRDRYVGRIGVRRSNLRLKDEFRSNYVRCLIAHARQISPARERTVHHYCASMQRALSQVALALKPKGRAILVLGNAKWNGRRVRATHLLKELARDRLDCVETLSYAARNRYMSYKRHNGANVDREYVLVLRKRA